MLSDALSRFKPSGNQAMVTFSGKQTEPHEGIISNQPFWPEMDIARFSEEYRIPNDLEGSTVAEHLVQGMTDINHRLSEYRVEQLHDGYLSLEEVPAEQVGGESILLVLYRRAVFCRGKASVCRDYPTIDRREPAENQAKAAPDTETTYLRFADEAIRQFLGLTDISVDLL